MGSQPLPLPTFLRGVTPFSNVDRPTKSAFRIYENGRLSLVPCALCVEAGTPCIVAEVSGRCLRCSHKSKSNRHCLAEGVKVTDFRTERLSRPKTSSQTAVPVLQSIAAFPSVSTSLGFSAASSGSQEAMTRPNARVTRQSVFPVEANVATVGASKHGSNTTHGATTKQKRKRPVSDPADAIALSAKRPRGNTPPMVIEHPYAPTAPKATGGIFSPTDAAVTKKIFIPYGSLGYDLAIRTEDPVAWAQWAKDLCKEIQSLRHIQDLGDYTHAIVEMMMADGVWPGVTPFGLDEV